MLIDLDFIIEDEAVEHGKKITSSEIYFEVDSIVRRFVGPEQQIDHKGYAPGINIDEDMRPEIIISKPKGRPDGVLWATNCTEPRFTTTFDTRKFAESYRLEKFCRDNLNNPFSLDMPGLRSNNFTKTHAFIENYLDEYKCKHHIKFKLKPCMLGPFTDWREPVRLWWNEFVSSPWAHKKKQMLIIGKSPSTGKTVFVQDALFGWADPNKENAVPSEAIFTPERGLSNFAYSNAKVSFNSVLFIDEFAYNSYNTEILKLLAQGSPIAIKKKNINTKSG